MIKSSPPVHPLGFRQHLWDLKGPYHSFTCVIRVTVKRYLASASLNLTVMTDFAQKLLHFPSQIELRVRQGVWANRSQEEVVIFVGNIRSYFSPKVVISCSSFLYNEKDMAASETFLPASFTKPLRFFVPLYCLFITSASLWRTTSSAAFLHLDKFLHAGVYGLLAMTVSLAWPQLAKIKIWLGCLLFGGFIEIAQGILTAGRTPSFWDFLANGIGAFMALVLITVLNQKFTK